MDIVVLSWNRWQLLEEMVRKLRERTRCGHRIIVVDDGSLQEVQWQLCRMYKEGLVDELHLLDHIGYAGAVVRSFRFAKTDPFILSDGDINPPLLSEGWLTILLQRNWSQFSILALNTQLQSSLIMGLDEVCLYSGVAYLDGNYAKSKQTSGLGITQERLMEVHCAPFWLALVKQEVGDILLKCGYDQYKSHNPDLVYSNILRRFGRRVGIALDIWGTHTGLGWNRGYPVELYRFSKYYRPNIPTTFDGVPIYRNMTKEHWHLSSKCQREYTLDNVWWDYTNHKAQCMIVTAIHILHKCLPYPKQAKETGYEVVFKELNAQFEYKVI